MTPNPDNRMSGEKKAIMIETKAFNPDGDTRFYFTPRLNDEIEWKKNGVRGIIRLRCLGNTVKRVLCHDSAGKLVYLNPETASIHAVYRDGQRLSGEPIRRKQP